MRGERFSRREDLLALLWGFAEATLFFIVPDVLITFRALESSRRAVRASLVAGLGAVVGGLLMYGWGRISPETATRTLDLVPAISAGMIQDVLRQVQESGLGAMFVGAFTGKPYKIYAVAAGIAHLSPSSFALVSFPARIVRFLLLGLVVGRLSRRVDPWIPLRFRRILHVAGWTAFYAWYGWVMEG